MKKKNFNTIILKETELLNHYALHFTKNVQDANDLVQETFLKAITYSDKFNKGTNLKGWLYTIMKNTFINNYRKITRINLFVIQDEEISNSNLQYSATKNLGEGSFVLGDIKDALNALDKEHYIPFSMHFEGFKYHEIAEELNIPIGTVKTRIHVARKILKSSLKTYSGHKETYSIQV